MEPTSFTNPDDSKIWLRQHGNVKKFSDFFDGSLSKQKLPGIKEELAEFAKLFHSVTLRAAKTLAHGQEISLLRKGKHHSTLKKMVFFNSDSKLAPTTQEPSVAQKE